MTKWMSAVTEKLLSESEMDNEKADSGKEMSPTSLENKTRQTKLPFF